MSEEKRLVRGIIILVLIFNLLIITAGLKHDVNELEEKVNKLSYEIENKVGDIE